MTRSRSIPTHFEAPVGEHSMKLEKFYDIVREAPFLPTGEAFQRKGRHGSLICLRTRRSCWRQRSKGQRDNPGAYRASSSHAGFSGAYGPMRHDSPRVSSSSLSSPQPTQLGCQGVQSTTKPRSDPGPKAFPVSFPFLLPQRSPSP
jgi:hypothetical protein